MSVRKTGAKQPEVIQQWADMDSEGATFERHRMDAQVQSICITDQAGVPDALKDTSKGIKVKASDVNYLVRLLLCDMLMRRRNSSSFPHIWQRPRLCKAAETSMRPFLCS